MKKFQLLSLFMMLFAITSCSNDDDPVTNLAENAVGSYSGYTNASSTYFSGMLSENQTVTISSSSLNKVNINYTSNTWGTITITNAEITGTDGNIHISGAGKSKMTHAGATKEYDCTVEGTLIGKELELTFSCPAVMGGLNIEFKQGAIPAELVIPGTYTGYTEAKSAYFSGMMADDQTITITKNDDNTFKVVYISDSWGEFLIERAEATYKDGAFTLKGNGTTKMGMGGNLKDYDCNIEGTVDAAKTAPTFTFSVPAVMGGLSIVFQTGDMPAEE